MIIGILESIEIDGVVVYERPSTVNDNFREARLKFEAQMALAVKKITIPTRDEWIGLNLLERDSEL